MSTMTCPTKKKQKKVHRLPGKCSRGASHKNQKLNLWPAQNMDLLMAEYYQQLAANNDDDKVVNKSTLAKNMAFPLPQCGRELNKSSKERAIAVVVPGNHESYLKVNLTKLFHLIDLY